MKIESHISRGAPNHQLAVDRVGKILRQETASADVFEVEIEDATMAGPWAYPDLPAFVLTEATFEAKEKSR